MNGREGGEGGGERPRGFVFYSGNHARAGVNGLASIVRDAWCVGAVGVRRLWTGCLGPLLLPEPSGSSRLGW